MDLNITVTFTVCDIWTQETMLVFYIKMNKQSVPLKGPPCQLTVCFEFQGRSKRRTEHKSYVMQMVFRSKVQS